MDWYKHRNRNIHNVVDDLERLLLKNHPNISFQILSKKFSDGKCYLKIKYKGYVLIRFSLLNNKYMYSEDFKIDAMIYQTKRKYILRTNYPKFKKWLQNKLGCLIWNIRTEIIDGYNFPYKVSIFSNDEERNKYFQNRKIRLRKEKIKYINEME